MSNLAYDPFNHLVSEQASMMSATGTSGLTVTSSYGNRGRIQSEIANPGSNPVYSYSVPTSGGYTGNGNLVSNTDTVMGTLNMKTNSGSPGYDSLSRLSAATWTPVSGTAQSFCWTYDDFGNRTAQESATQPFTNSPGASACQLGSGMLLSNDWAQYNGTVNGTANNQMSATYENPNQGNSSGYDQAGDVIYDGVNSYAYDGEGRLCAVYNHLLTQFTGYVYNAEGTRVAKGSLTSLSCNLASNGFSLTNQYLLGEDGNQVTELNKTTGTMAWAHSNTWAGALLEATYDYDASQGVSPLHFHLSDPLGTRRVQANVNGVVENWIQSLPFGDELSLVPNSSCTAAINCYTEDPTEHHFTGKERDQESGNDYFAARSYTSSMGRFLSPDSGGIGFSDFDSPQSLNLYSYVQNNPLSWTDPDGHHIQICTLLNGVQTCTDLEDDQYAAAQQANYNGGLSGPSLADLENSLSGTGNITDSAGNVVGTVQWTPDYPGIQGRQAIQGFRQISHDSQGAINYFLMNMAMTLGGGAAARLVDFAGGVIGGYVNASKLGMLKPLVTNPKLAAIVDELFQATDKVPGGTAGAVRFESESGVYLSPSGHFQDAQDIRNQLNNLLSNPNTGWSSNDQAVAKELIRDLQNALQ